MRCARRPRCASALAGAERGARARLGRDASRCAPASTPARSSPATRAGGQRFVTGDAVNVAARLEQAAPPGRDPARRADLPPRPRRGRGRGGRAARAEGQERAGAARTGCSALDAGAAGPRPAPRLADGRPGARARRCSSSAFERAVGERACHLFTVLGAAGVGQVAARRRVPRRPRRPRRRSLRGRCLPYGEGITYLAAGRGRSRGLYGDDPRPRRSSAAVSGDETRT